MVIDTSALIAVLRFEADWLRYRTAISEASVLLLSVVSVMEATMVLEGRPGGDSSELDLLIHRTPLEVRGVDLDQLEVARDAFRKFGKGRHRAALNFGDCFSYALAKTSREPLLYKGADFGCTDVRSVLPD